MTDTNISKASIRHGDTAPRRQHQRNKDQEYGLPPEGINTCPTCGAFYYTKSWHKDLDSHAEELVATHGGMHTHTCPACAMLASNTYEGEVIITLTDDHKHLKEEIMNGVHNSGKQGQEHDPMHRILWIDEDADGTIHVFTSENQLAVRIGHALESAHKASTLDIQHSHEHDATRVHWTY